MAYESWASSAANRASMLGNRSKNTKPELELRSRLHRRGLRFRVCHKPLNGVRYTADVVFTRAKVAVFLDGCYWHGCPLHYKPPRTNPEYWVTKIARNRERDEEFDRLLTAAGWTVIRHWAHDDLDSMVEEVEAAVRRDRVQH